MKGEFSEQIFGKKSLDIKFLQNPSSATYRRTDGQTDMAKLIIAFRNFANVPNKQEGYNSLYHNESVFDASVYDL